MKAITIWQPEATLTALGEKRLETRTWRLPEKMVGARVAIHAALRPLPQELLLADPERDSSKWAVARWILEMRLGDAWRELPRGAVVATARLQAAGPADELLNQNGHLRSDAYGAPDEVWLGDFSAGHWAWRLVDVVRLQDDDVVSVTGRQRFWELPYVADRAVRAAQERAIRL